MSSARILVVEDEGIIAQDIKNCLEGLGYDVPDVVFTGEEAIEKVGKIQPDLVLMDIVLKGEKDGIETAREIRDRYNIPIVYLTAYEDDKTLKRARATEPLGYILKPFEERYLRSSIEMALYKHKMEFKLKERETWLSTILHSVADAVIVTDENGKITFMNPNAESLTGWTISEVHYHELQDVIVFINEETRTQIENPVIKVLQENIVLNRSNHIIFYNKNGNEISIDYSASPIKDEKEKLIGVVLVLHDVSDRKIAENALRESEKKYRNLFDYATDAIFVQSLEGEILSVNNEACKLLGYIRDELYLLNFSDIFYQSNGLNYEKIVDYLKNNDSYRFEAQYRRKDSSLVDVELSMRKIQLIDEQIIQAFVRDITERKKSQRQLNIFAHAIKSISECISITDLDNKLLFVNNAFIKTYGYSAEELMGKPMNIIRSQKNPKTLYKEIHEETLKGGWQGELINRDKNGNEFPVFLSTSLVKDDKGTPIAMIGVASDITERKKLENALKDSEKDYRELFENAHDAIIIYRPDDYIILDVNESACKIYGYTRNEFIGLSIENISNVQEHELSPITGEEGKSRFETIHFRKDGSPMYLEVNVTNVIYKGQNAVVSVNHDITERKNTIEKLISSEKRYQDLYDNAPDIYVSISKDGTIKSVNKFGAEYLGYNKEELIGEKVWIFVYEQDLKKVRSQIERIFEQHIEKHEMEFRKVKKDGTVIWVMERTQLKCNEYNVPTELLIICRDVTESKETEKILREKEEHYRAMFEKNKAVKMLIDPDSGNVVDANIAACEYYGYNIDTLTNKKITEIIISPPLEIKKEFNRAKSEESSYFIFRNRLASGEVRDVEFYTGPIDVRGKTLLFCIVHDVTERRKAELALLESEKKYKNLAENAPIAVTRIALNEKRYDFVNKEFYRQSGYTMEEYNSLSDKDLIEMIHPEDRGKLFSFYKNWSEKGYKGTQHIDYRIINRNKEILWLDTYLYADKDNFGNIASINQICIDITTKKITEEALKESENRFRALIENSSDMIALLNEKAVLTYISPSTKRILGYEIEDVTNYSFYDFIHPEDLSFIKKSLSKAINEKFGIITFQYRFKHKNGSWLWIEATANNLFDVQNIKSIVLNYRDISQRKQAEEDLILQKSYFQQLFESSPEGIVVLDNTDKIINVNKGFERIFQYTLNDIKGKSINECLVPQNLSEQASQMSQFVLKGEIIHKETTRKRKDGSVVDVSILGYPIKLGNNQVGVYGIYNDISERKTTEKALKTSEERYRAFVNQSTEGIWRFEFLEPIPISKSSDEQIKLAFKYGYLAECNDAVAKMYGYETAEQITGVRLNELLVESDSKNIEYLKAFVLSGYRLTDAESHEIDKDRNHKYFLNNFIGIIEDGKIVRAWGTQRDITASKLAEEELKRTQFRLTTLLSNLPDVVLYETGGGEEFVTENVINLLGYPATRFTENPSYFLSIVHPGDLKIVNEKTKKWRKEGHPGILNNEFRCRRADGRYIWIEDHMVAVKTLTEKTHLAGVLINIDDRKRSEDKLKKLADKLAASNKELEQFAYVASHDLQEPLRMVASYIQLLQRRYKGQLDSQADEFIGFAVDGVARMKALINDLLIYSRVNTQVFPSENVDCNQVLHQVINNLHTSIEETGAKINYQNLPVVKANHVQITQIFQNLLSNAIKFHGEKPPIVNISVKKTDDEWLFSVTDNGIGIDKEFADRIFIVFQRLHNYNEYPGTGIGLAICKKIIEKLGGHIWVESEAGKGSTFNFTIPF